MKITIFVVFFAFVSTALGQKEQIDIDKMKLSLVSYRVSLKN